MIVPSFTPGNDVPVGTIIAYAGIIDESAQENKTGTINNIQAFGWVVCDGRQLPISKYPELFQAIGFLYNLKGDPTDSSEDLFRVPDYRGYFLRGDSGDSGNDPDADERKFANGDKVTAGKDKTGSIQADAIQTHQHQYSQAQGNVTVATGSNTVAISPNTTVLTTKPTDSKTTTPGDIRISSETRAKNFYVNYLIKYAYL